MSNHYVKRVLIGLVALPLLPAIIVGACAYELGAVLMSVYIERRRGDK